MGAGFSAAGRTLFHRRWRKRPFPNGILANLIDIVKLLHNLTLTILDLAAWDCHNPCELNGFLKLILTHSYILF